MTLIGIIFQRQRINNYTLGFWVIEKARLTVTSTELELRYSLINVGVTIVSACVSLRRVQFVTNLRLR